MAFQVSQVHPIFRIFDLAKAKEFYVDFLGFKVDWEHRFGENFPIYMQVSRDGLTLHLSEHHGDCCPGSAIVVRVTDLRSYHAELIAKQYRNLRPGIEKTFHQSLGMDVIDPFGNKIRFDESI